MLRMIRKYLPAFGTLFAITFFLVMALTALAQVRHAQQDKKGSRSAIEATRPSGSAQWERRSVVEEERTTRFAAAYADPRTGMIGQGLTRTDHQESEPHRLFQSNLSAGNGRPSGFLLVR
ncbi:hypothetical protein [Candidatus Manganitrophus noduliformans]|uniref:Uncharacterized protein n=1 Tax=Candidatus Manganitrophus noduliformans TaxID=2606439 RepID=A0A7X6DQU0_9BACT|nr:hypothetical protein [Candidatus Manganitrophus noduliformans]NKE71698.1 hypothetical protein [Candidatus Manganitrophus noduliformans]